MCYLLIYLLPYLLTYFLTYLPTYLLTYIPTHERTNCNEAPLPAGADLFTTLQALTKVVLKCNDTTVPDILHKRVSQSVSQSIS